MKPLLITPGEPAGIGPDLTLTLAHERWPHPWAAVADPELLHRRARALGLELDIHPWSPDAPPPTSGDGRLSVLPVPLATRERPGHPDPANAGYVLHCLDQAIDACLQGRAGALVTGPIHKGIINQAGTPFTGHTEYLAQRAGCARVVMMLATEGLRVALATTHLPLSQVPGAIDRPGLQHTLEILHHDLQRRFAIPRPRILVCGLNPHAGEDGHLGREELDIITPVLTELRARGMDLHGPLPADTLFTPQRLEGADAVLAMYHDQGLPVLKYKGFGRAINVTLGLPFIRTSVDHGTACELAGSGRADPSSLRLALETAQTMARRESP